MRNGKYSGPVLILAAALILLLQPGCAGSQEQSAPQAETGAQQTDASQAPAAEVIYTREDPGAYGGKEDSHVPVVTYERTGSGLKVTVSVSHEMNPETPHFIEWIQLKDGDGGLLGERTFRATDEKAEAVFELASIPDRLIAYEKCNLHGIWKELVDVI